VCGTSCRRPRRLDDFSKRKQLSVRKNRLVQTTLLASRKSPPKILPDRHLRCRNPVRLATGSFVPFTIAAGCSTDKATGTEDITFDWAEFLPAERIKEGTTEIAFELVAFAALVDCARAAKYDSGTFTLAC
jgi:hypothetical protein